VLLVRELKTEEAAEGATASLIASLYNAMAANAPYPDAVKVEARTARRRKAN
jgi:hypothetical protein